ncbi:hypothetical protein KEH51_23745 [[Brevibacterium] frigoritolerans]|uniref:Carbohydrate kinase PfkB domain-containing protein n=1 Tax=Peribacillus frigoritolerans TaxID=450367 RepID=A0A941FTM5_9BACI|nr:hypothetical protein [Peribacillus frigoritolerans]
MDKAVRIAKENGTKIVFDPNIRLKIWGDEKEARHIITKYASKSDIVMPGVSEAEFLFGSHTRRNLPIIFMNSVSKQFYLNWAKKAL